MTDADKTVPVAAPPADLEAIDLVKQYRGRSVVNGVSVRVRCGEIVGLLGPNGAGKTTSFYMIVGLVRPHSGKVVFRGQNISRLPVFRCSLPAPYRQPSLCQPRLQRCIPGSTALSSTVISVQQRSYFS